jgi:hypothetical protein
VVGLSGCTGAAAATTANVTTGQVTIWASHRGRPAWPIP